MAASGVKALTTAALAVNAAISAMVLKAASNRKQLELMAAQAKDTEDNFQALSFATKRYNIDAEKMADISKDLSDRIGEFSAVGTGAFQDYADVMRMTKEEARQVAIEFQSMSSEAVIGTMVSKMEGAGVAGDQLTFVLESMAGDLSQLKGLFADNGKELETLKSRFDDINGTLLITENQAEDLKKVSTRFNELTSQMGNVSTLISATLAPVMDDFFNDVIEVVPGATQTIIDFFNSFLDPENINSQKAVTGEISDAAARLLGLEIRLRDAKEATNKSSSGLVDTNEITIATTEQLIEKEKQRIEGLNKQLKILKESQLVLADAKQRDGGRIGVDPTDSSTGGLGTGDEIEAIRDRFKTETQLLKEKLDEELLIVGNNKKDIEDLTREHAENLLEIENQRGIDLIEQEFADEENALIASYERKLELAADDASMQLEAHEAFLQSKAALDKHYEDTKIEGENTISDEVSKVASKDAKEIKKGDKDKLKNSEKTNDDFLAAALNVGGAILEDNKLVAAGLIVADTATGIQKSLSIAPYDYVNVGIIAATGALNLATALGASKGGGSGASAPSRGSPSQPDFEEETTSLELSSAGAGGATASTINFGTDSGDDLIDAIAAALNKAQREGRA